MSEKNYNDIDLQNAWKEMSKQKFSNQKIKKTEIMNALQSNSLDLLEELGSNFRKEIDLLKYVTIGLIVLAIAEGLYYNQITYLQPMAIFYVLMSYLYSKKLNRFSKNQVESSILSELKRKKEIIHNSLIHNRLLGYPFIFFFYIYKILCWTSQKSIEGLALKVCLSTVLIAISIVFIEWYTKNQYGDKLKNLDKNIIRLETLQ